MKREMKRGDRKITGELAEILKDFAECNPEVCAWVQVKSHVLRLLSFLFFLFSCEWAYLREIQKEIKSHGCEPPTQMTICKHITSELKLCSRKLEQRAIQANSDRAREHFQTLKNMGYKSKQLWFIDETGRRIVSCRRHFGWMKKGMRWMKKEMRHPKRSVFFVEDREMSVIATMNHTGFLIDSLEITEETVTGVTFQTWCNNQIVPRLGKFRGCEENSVVIMDNAKGHKETEICFALKRLTKEAGAFLPFLRLTAPF